MHPQPIRFHAALRGVRLVDAKSAASRNAERLQEKSETAQNATPSDEQFKMFLSTIGNAINAHTAKQLEANKELEMATAELAVAIAEQIVGHSVDTGQLSLGPLIRNGVRQMAGSGALQIRLSEKDLANLDQAKLRLGEGSESAGADVVFVSDSNLPPGSCIVESGDRQVASSLKQRLNDARRLVLEGFQHDQI